MGGKKRRFKKRERRSFNWVGSLTQQVWVDGIFCHGLEEVLEIVPRRSIFTGRPELFLADSLDDALGTVPRGIEKAIVEILPFVDGDFRFALA